jgi:hypothetical protein
VTRVAVMYNPQTSPAGYLPSLRSAADASADVRHGSCCAVR